MAMKINSACDTNDIDMTVADRRWLRYDHQWFADRSSPSLLDYERPVAPPLYTRALARCGWHQPMSSSSSSAWSSMEVTKEWYDRIHHHRQHLAVAHRQYRADQWHGRKRRKQMCRLLSHCYDRRRDPLPSSSSSSSSLFSDEKRHTRHNDHDSKRTADGNDGSDATARKKRVSGASRVDSTLSSLLPCEVLAYEYGIAWPTAPHVTRQSLAHTAKYTPHTNTSSTTIGRMFTAPIPLPPSPPVSPLPPLHATAEYRALLAAESSALPPAPRHASHWFPSPAAASAAPASHAASPSSLTAQLNALLETRRRAMSSSVARIPFTVAMPDEGRSSSQVHTPVDIVLIGRHRTSVFGQRMLQRDGPNFHQVAAAQPIKYAVEYTKTFHVYRLALVVAPLTEGAARESKHDGDEGNHGDGDGMDQFITERTLVCELTCKATRLHLSAGEYELVVTMYDGTPTMPLPHGDHDDHYFYHAVVMADHTAHRVPRLLALLQPYFRNEHRLNQLILQQHVTVTNYWLRHTELQQLQCLPEAVVWRVSTQPSALRQYRRFFPCVEYRRTIAMTLAEIMARNDAVIYTISEYIDEPLYGCDYSTMTSDTHASPPPQRLLSMTSSSVGWWSPPSSHLVAVMSRFIGASSGPWQSDACQQNNVWTAPMAAMQHHHSPLPSPPRRNYRGQSNNNGVTSPTVPPPPNEGYTASDRTPVDDRSCVTWRVGLPAMSGGRHSEDKILMVTLWSDGICWIKVSVPHLPVHTCQWYCGPYTLLPVPTPPSATLMGASGGGDRVTWRLRARVTVMADHWDKSRVPGATAHDFVMDIYETPNQWTPTLTPAVGAAVTSLSTRTPIAIAAPILSSSSSPSSSVGATPVIVHGNDDDNDGYELPKAVRRKLKRAAKQQPHPPSASPLPSPSPSPSPSPPPPSVSPPPPSSSCHGWSDGHGSWMATGGASWPAHVSWTCITAATRLAMMTVPPCVTIEDSDTTWRRLHALLFIAYSTEIRYHAIDGGVSSSSTSATSSSPSPSPSPLPSSYLPVSSHGNAHVTVMDAHAQHAVGALDRHRTWHYAPQLAMSTMLHAHAPAAAAHASSPSSSSAATGAAITTTIGGAPIKRVPPGCMPHDWYPGVVHHETTATLSPTTIGTQLTTYAGRVADEAHIRHSYHVAQKAFLERYSVPVSLSIAS